jgi:putative DNA primase/helicase
MLVVNWGVTTAEVEQRPFDALVAEILLERSGILNWFVEGALDFLTYGLVIAQESVDATHKYRADMDSIWRFIASCVKPTSGAKTSARRAYNAYRSWALANALTPVLETRFGRNFHTRFERAEERSMNFFLNCELHDVPCRSRLARSNA